VKKSYTGQALTAYFKGAARNGVGKNGSQNNGSVMHGSTKNGTTGAAPAPVSTEEIA
jgi:hypothetical protein